MTFDGGQTWTESVIRQSAYDATGDPGVAFDADGTAYLSTLGFLFSQGRFCCVSPDVIVSHSTDGGLTWSAPIVRVASGTGTFTSRGIVNDKPYISAWGHGNAIVTYTQFNQGFKGSYMLADLCVRDTRRRRYVVDAYGNLGIGSVLRWYSGWQRVQLRPIFLAYGGR